MRSPLRQHKQSNVAFDIMLLSKNSSTGVSHRRKTQSHLELHSSASGRTFNYNNKALKASASFVIQPVHSRRHVLKAIASSTTAQSTVLSTWQPLEMLGFAVLGLALYATYKLVRLATSDADLELLAKGPLKADAFQGKVVWITGASQGIGKLVATYLAKRGAKLILSARSVDKLESVKKELEMYTKDVMVLPLDLTGDFTKLEEASKNADSAFGGQGIDYLIHNAGASMSALASEVSSDVTDTLFGVNTLGPIKLTRAALPCMLKRNKGRIVVVASMAAKVPSPGQAVYSACKMSIYGYFSSLASEIADTGVQVTICCPGPVAAAQDAAPRAVYGASGLIQQEQQQQDSKPDKARMSPERCVELIAAAAGHGVAEAWISKHPVLALAYIFQLAPWLGRKVLAKVGPSRARALKEGKSGYDVKNIAKTAAKGQ